MKKRSGIITILRVRFQTKIYLFYTMLITGIVFVLIAGFYALYINWQLDKYAEDVAGIVADEGAELEQLFSQGQKIAMNVKYSPYISSEVYRLSMLGETALTTENQSTILQLEEALEMMRYAESDYINRITIFTTKGVLATTSNYYTDKVYSTEIATTYIDAIHGEDDITNFMYHIYVGNDVWVAQDVPVIIMVSRFGSNPNAMVEIQL